MKNTKVKAACALALSLALLGSTVPAQGADAPSSSSSTATQESTDAAAFSTWLGKQGVSSDTQKKLVAKMERGELIDSMNGSKPVSTKSYQEDGREGVRNTFRDGSVSVVSTTEATPAGDGSIGTRAITNCSTTGGSGWINYANCNVNIGNGIISLAFYATFERYSGVRGKIIRVWGASSSSSYGTITTPKLSIVTEEGNPAKARAKAVYTSWNGAHTENPELWLSVSKDSYTSYTAGT